MWGAKHLYYKLLGNRNSKCVQKKNKCIVLQLCYDDFLNFKDNSAYPQYSTVLKDQCYYSDSSGKNKMKVMWSQIKQVLFSRESPDDILFKYDYSQIFLLCSFKDSQPLTRNRISVPHNLKKKYKSPISIAYQKYKDLNTMCEKLYIKRQYHCFFESLPYERRENKGKDYSIPQIVSMD